MAVKEGIPIVFFHTGDSWYLKYTLRQAQFANPQSDIYLVGDEANRHYSFVHHVPFQRYEALTEEFRKVYLHRNSNAYDYEITCFLRWFYLLGLVEEKKINSFIYLDSDVLAFADFKSLKGILSPFDVANTGVGVGMPAFTYFKSKEVLGSFCHYMLQNYIEPGLKVRLAQWWDQFEAKTWGGGICDMTLFDFYFKEANVKSGKLDKVGLVAFDASITSTAGYETKGTAKKVYWKNKQPYCKWLDTGEMVRFATFHYQGSSKNLILKHYQGPFGITLKDRLSQTFPTLVRALYKLKSRLL